MLLGNEACWVRLVYRRRYPKHRLKAIRQKGKLTSGRLRERQPGWSTGCRSSVLRAQGWKAASKLAREDITGPQVSGVATGVVGKFELRPYKVRCPASVAISGGQHRINTGIIRYLEYRLVSVLVSV